MLLYAMLVCGSLVSLVMMRCRMPPCPVMVLGVRLSLCTHTVTGRCPVGRVVTVPGLGLI